MVLDIVCIEKFWSRKKTDLPRRREEREGNLKAKKYEFGL
jgi:hypothetical protein